MDPAAAEGSGVLARCLGTTPHSVTAAALALVLSRCSGQDDLVLGTVLANRPHPALEGVVGFFATTLPLRIRLDGDPTVAELVRRVHGVAARAQAHAGAPLDRIVERLGIRRDFRHAPLVQTVLSFVDDAPEPPSFPGADVEGLPLDSGTAPFDLTWVVERGRHGMHASLQYDTALWDASGAVLLARRVEAVLAAFAADPDARISRVPIPGGEEAHAWGDGGPPAPGALAVHERFRARARLAPLAPAVAWYGGVLDYAWLDDRSDRAATALRALGMGPESRVAVRMARTPEMVAALLAILKAGAAYVPLDPTHPPARHAAVLASAGATLLVVDEGGPPFAGDVRAVPFAQLDSDPGEPWPGPCARNLAYVLFTSGSTGGPKGVEIEHGSATALIGWMGETFADELRGPVLCSTPLTFDASVAEIFGTLTHGGTLVLVENALSDPPPGWEPRTAIMTPTAATELLDGGRFPAHASAVLLGGEAVAQRLVDRLRALGAMRRVLNLYGPTEDTTYTTCAELETAAERITLGRPIAGGRLRVLDAALRPAGTGIPGEAWTAGAGVARGYAGRPALTAERFLPDPYGPPGSRMYRALDRMCWHADGTLAYFGRADAQVKVRGQRVEPGEVEETLRAHPSVAAAAATVRGEGAEQVLAAYLVLRRGAPRPDATELRAWVRDRLPPFMLPGSWTWLDALPRTTSGKLDRRALPDPAAPERGRVVEPRTPLEARLAALWADVLGVERVGATDDFFDLGGQSILATRLVARIRAETGVEVPVSQLLQAPTVEAMARAVEGDAQRVRPPLVPLQRFGDRRPLYLVHPAGGHVVCYRGMAMLMAPHQPVLALQPRGVDDGLQPLDDIAEMAAFYVEAVRGHQPSGPYRLAGWSFGGVVAWEMARQLRGAGQEVEMLALLDTTSLGMDESRLDPRDTADVVWNTVAGLAGMAVAMRVDVDTLRGLRVRDAARVMLRGMDAPRILPESRLEDVVALTAVRAANLRAQAAYTAPPVDVHLTYFQPSGSARMDEFAGAVPFWSALALRGATVHRVGGSHGLILNEPHVHAIVDAVLALG
jgi:amino acid adenylation domain-containing protein